MTRTQEKVHNFIQSLYHAAYQRLMQTNMNKEQADSIACEITNNVLDEFGGENLYIPRNITGKVAKRNARIFVEFTGNNHDLLAKKYGLTLQRIYTIIKEESNRHKKEHQPSLFGNDA